MVVMSFNWGYATHQLIAAGLALALGGVLLLLLCRCAGPRIGTAAGRWIGLPSVALLLALAGTFSAELGFGAALPAPRLAWTLGVALPFYWLAVWWPLLAWRNIDGERRGSRAVRRAVCAALPLGALWSTAIEPLLLEVEPRQLAFDEIGARTLKVVHLSDLQLVDLGPRERAVVEEVAAFAPDLILFTGDYIAQTSDPDTAIAAARWVLQRLRAPHGIFATTSDSDTEAQRARIFDGLDVTYLRNRNTTLEVGGVPLRIGGLDHLAPDIEAMRRGARAEELFLVLCHSPDLAADVDREVPHADAYFCGHTHGGQLQLPGFGPPLTFSTVPRRIAAGGVFETPGGRPWLVTRGLGMEGCYAPRFRFLCRPHLFTLTFGPRNGSVR